MAIPVNDVFVVREPDSTSYVCTFDFEKYITIKHIIYIRIMAKMKPAALGFLRYFTTLLFFCCATLKPHFLYEYFI
jgi:hypothetical protein